MPNCFVTYRRTAVRTHSGFPKVAVTLYAVECPDLASANRCAMDLQSRAGVQYVCINTTGKRLGKRKVYTFEQYSNGKF